ncbi:MAG: shikimate kinase [Gemmatimonadaceae bacterium]
MGAPSVTNVEGAGPHLLLVGLPGAGKTVCGELLAKRLGRLFIDLDQEIERMAGLTVPEIFAQFGEAHFRDMETEATRALRSRLPAIVAPGGGWIERPSNRELAKGVYRLVYLRVSPATALRRLGEQTSSRPLLNGGDPEARIAGLLDRRAPLYMTADAELDTEVLTPEEVVDQLIPLALRWGGALG